MEANKTRDLAESCGLP